MIRQPAAKSTWHHMSRRPPGISVAREQVRPGSGRWEPVLTEDESDKVDEDGDEMDGSEERYGRTTLVSFEVVILSARRPTAAHVIWPLLEDRLPSTPDVRVIRDSRTAPASTASSTLDDHPSFIRGTRM